MEFFRRLVDTLIHLSPDKLNDFISYVGVERLYMVVFAIVFMETGFVVTPFLPGDSLLFTLGAVAASPDSPLKLPLVMLILCAAANSGDLVNYTLGKHLGPKVFAAESSRLLNKKHLISAQKFYEKHGRKTIIMARFVPVIRTFAPFVAGIGRMNFFRFASFSVVGGMVWVNSLTLVGYWFGSQETIKRNFHLVIVAIIVISVMPIAIEFFRARRHSKKSTQEHSPQPVDRQ